ncbi:nitrogenase cofactor biosynthesis protein NifB [Thiorhodospira sibirica]|uniref:nitrogenase cofactor biosynthesis protein NifB n=1 Tax=Thiorhodospira sibirica TaxID=154347 RepID=UPI00022C0BCE|nr:nitrogenase cofactor biosynthesis protein NifB [Thiorhodospira sibirica]
MALTPVSSTSSHSGVTRLLPDAVAAQIEDHPCFSPEAHQHFARMHLAVAPACNIQCHYCNRKYDCSNESRPGVVSEVLKPEQAVHKALVVASQIPNMTVVGIAGPGDPLANPARTFATLEGLATAAPDLRLCISTNGLALPESVEQLARYQVSHVTITINCLDPEIGAQIYPWIIWNKRRVYGVEAARILIEQQLQGLAMLVARGILVKINSVMIPGINDAHLVEVAAKMREQGAFLHNIIPLIARPEHGTFYGLNGQAEPTPEALADLQARCGQDMQIMSHCQQCRADAVGMLGEDRHEDFTLAQIEHVEIDYAQAQPQRAAVQAAIKRSLHTPASPGTASSAVIDISRLGRTKPAKGNRATAGCQCNSLSAARSETVAIIPPLTGAHLRPVRVAVASLGDGRVSEHFGRATSFMIYQATPEGIWPLETREVLPYCAGSSPDGAGVSALERIIDTLHDCAAVLCAKVGFEAWQGLEAAGILPSGEHDGLMIEQAVIGIYRELMNKAAALANCSTTAA